MSETVQLIKVKVFGKPDTYSAPSVNAVRSLWCAGHSISKIGEQFNVTRNVIVGIAHRNDFPPRPSPIIKSDGLPDLELRRRVVDRWNISTESKKEIGARVGLSERKVLRVLRWAKGAGCVVRPYDAERRSLRMQERYARLRQEMGDAAYTAMMSARAARARTGLAST